MNIKETPENNTKMMIAESLRSLMMTKSFENIRIKNICDDVGVVRVTFYNYFLDKYDALDYLIGNDLVYPFENLIHQGDLTKLIGEMVMAVDSQKKFYEIAYRVSGQNGFEELMRSNLLSVFKIMLHKSSMNLSEIDCDLISEYISETFTYSFKQWVSYKKEIPANDFIKYLQNLVNNSIQQFLS